MSAPITAPKAVPAKRCQASLIGLMLDNKITTVETGAQ